MRKLFYFCVAALLAASCSFFDTTPEDRTNPSQTPGGGGNGSGEDPGTTPGKRNPFSDALQGWRCISYYQNKKTFDQTLQFHYDELGRLDYYLEHTLSYNNDGIMTWADDNYKRIYHYTSPTHADFYNEVIAEGSRGTWYDFDAEGRIIKKNNAYGDPYLYHYNDKGQLIEIENAYMYEDSEDEKKYASWKKSRIVDWYEDCPHYFSQKWTSGSETVYRNEMTIIRNIHYTNPFRNMAIDPTVMGMTIVPDGGGIGLFDLEGWWGTRSKYLITGWYAKDNTYNRLDVTLLTDKDDHITGMTTQGSGVFGSRREYTFSWKGEAPLLKKDGVPEIN